MHTTTIEKTVFNHNGDFTGDVRICTQSARAGILVPFEDLKEFVAQYVTYRRISRLENTAQADEILGLE